MSVESTVGHARRRLTQNTPGKGAQKDAPPVLFIVAIDPASSSRFVFGLPITSAAFTAPQHACQPAKTERSSYLFPQGLLLLVGQRIQNANKQGKSSLRASDSVNRNAPPPFVHAIHAHKRTLSSMPSMHVSEPGFSSGHMFNGLDPQLRGQ